MNRAALIFVSVAFGVFAPVASAHVHAHPRSFWHTYPVASPLCAEVAAGQVPNRLASDVAELSAACATLSNSYQQARGAFEAAVAPIAAEVQSTLAGLAAARQAAMQSHDWSAYRAAVKQADSTFKSLRAQERAARLAYVTAIRAARHTFWATVHSLVGANGSGGNSGNPSPPPAPTVPVIAS